MLSVEGNSMCVSASQYAEALVPMVVTPSPMVSDSWPEHLRNERRPGYVI